MIICAAGAFHTETAQGSAQLWQEDLTQVLLQCQQRRNEISCYFIFIIDFSFGTLFQWY